MRAGRMPRNAAGGRCVIPPPVHRAEVGALRSRPIAARALKAFAPGGGAALVSLGGAAAAPARADDDPVAQDRHRALAHDHLTAGAESNAPRGRLVGARLQVAAGAAEGGGRDRLALAAV